MRRLVLAWQRSSTGIPCVERSISTHGGKGLLQHSTITRPHSCPQPDLRSGHPLNELDRSLKKTICRG